MVIDDCSMSNNIAGNDRGWIAPVQTRLFQISRYSDPNAMGHPRQKLQDFELGERQIKRVAIELNLSNCYRRLGAFTTRPQPPSIELDTRKASIVASVSSDIDSIEADTAETHQDSEARRMQGIIVPILISHS